MAIEVLYDVIRLSEKGEDTLQLKVKDNSSQYITFGYLWLVIEGLGRYYGTYNAVSQTWAFTIPSNDKKIGKYKYYYEYQEDALHSKVILDFPSYLYIGD